MQPVQAVELLVLPVHQEMTEQQEPLVLRVHKAQRVQELLVLRDLTE